MVNGPLPSIWTMSSGAPRRAERPRRPRLIQAAAQPDQRDRVRECACPRRTSLPCLLIAKFTVHNEIYGSDMELNDFQHYLYWQNRGWGDPKGELDRDLLLGLALTSIDYSSGRQRPSRRSG